MGKKLNKIYVSIWWFAYSAVIVLVTMQVVFFVLDLGKAVFTSPVLTAFVSRFWLNCIGLAGIAVIGGLLYWFRESKRAWYGLVEISFALAYGWYSISKVEESGPVEVLSIIASVYLVVRGLDNYLKGREVGAATA